MIAQEGYRGFTSTHRPLYPQPVLAPDVVVAVLAFSTSIPTCIRFPLSGGNLCNEHFSLRLAHYLPSGEYRRL